MKAIFTILAAVLTLQAGLLFAGNENSSVPAASEMSTIAMASLAPVTPAEATFEEIFNVEINDLMPVTLLVATFEDMPVEMTSMVDLQPMTPVTADFEDAVEGITAVDNGILAPVTPVEPDFE